MRNGTGMKEEIYGFIKQKNLKLPGMKAAYRNGNEDFVIAEIDEDISQGLSEQMMEVAFNQEAMPDYGEYMKQLGCHFLLFVWKEQEEDRLYFFSDTKRLRALEFLDYLVPEFGLVKGDAKGASGRISSVVLKVQMSGMDIEDTLEYFMKMAADYFEECECIEAGEYGKERENEIRLMRLYVKKRIPWAFVETTKLVAEGEEICIKSLENESGIIVKAAPDVYIMIGCRGEVYDIRRDKFENTYDKTAESLDVFEQMLEFLPEAEIVATGEYISLDELAHLCYPKTGVGIYAKELERRTKVFPAGGEEYYLGRPGDYMAVRPEDFCDIYVIQRQIFHQTYEEVSE